MDFSVLEVSSSDARRIASKFRDGNTNEQFCKFTVQPFAHGKSFIKVLHPNQLIRDNFIKKIQDYLEENTKSNQNETPIAQSSDKTNHPDTFSSKLNSFSTENASSSGSSFEPSCQRGGISPEQTPPLVSKDETLDEGKQESSSNDFTSKMSAVKLSDEHGDENQNTNDPYTCEVIKINISQPKACFPQVFQLRPYAAHFLNMEGVTRGTSIQLNAWPDLFEKKSMAIIGPEGSGKVFCYMPLVLSMSCQGVVAILTATDSRAVNLSRTASFYSLGVQIQHPPQKLQNLKKTVVVCNVGFFARHYKTLNPIMLVFDRLDRMLSSALEVTCVNVVENFADIPRVATARTYSKKLEDILRRMNIQSKVMVPMQCVDPVYRENLISLDDLSNNDRFAALVELLKLESEDNVILVFLDTKEEVRYVSEKLYEQALRSIYDLHEIHQEERIMLRSHLFEGVPGVYLACLSDHRWLHTTRSVHTIINYRPLECAQAYRYRRERLTSNGKIFSFLRRRDVNLFSDDLLQIMSNLKGHKTLSPSIRALSETFAKERTMRATLRAALLS